MTGRKNSLVDFKLEGNNYVTLGDGDIREVKGVGKTKGVSIPNLNNVLLVQGLAANLISISQLCDEGFHAKFTKDECIITNEENEEVMKGVRSKDNCYLWKPDTPVHPSDYSMIKEELKMYHHEFDESYDSDESDKESYIGDLTISELSTCFSETSIMKRKAVTKSKRVGPSKSWSWVIPKKRKEREIVEPESDVEVSVPDIPSSKKPIASKLAASIPNVPIDNEVLELIQEAGLLKTVCNLPKCYEKLVKEFVVNLSEECDNNRSAYYRKLFVRGKCVSFSPSVINKFLGRIDEVQTELEVTDNQVCQVITAKQVKSWPMKEKLIARTKAKFDYGAYIFDQTMKHAGSFSIKGPTAFPSLLSGIILDQYPNILNEHDVVCKRESLLAFHYKLFKGKHVPDIFMTSTKTSKSEASVSKAEVIAILKETCKELEARKISLEQMIRTLEMDENEEFAGTEEIEDKDDQEVEEESASHADDSEIESSSDTSAGSDSEQ
ncbi:uncharacterized protein LOC131630117 [Vicia villosa]|uniref:uncharacterized protein LOC131630117 n=1 Tax=Vicia villosa TaxID=3911 RepID=UPI00273A89A7|nr:uncharacterized protein LOC131630117 [Vicia villosa]